MFKKILLLLAFMVLVATIACEDGSSNTKPTPVSDNATNSQSNVNSSSTDSASNSGSDTSSNSSGSVARETSGDMSGGNLGVANDNYNSGSSGYSGRDGATQYQQNMIQSQSYGTFGPHVGPSTVYSGPR